MISWFQVGIEDIKKVYSLFVDEKRSMQYLRELQDEYMFHEVENDEGSVMHFIFRSSSTWHCFLIILIFYRLWKDGDRIMGLLTIGDLEMAENVRRFWSSVKSEKEYTCDL